MRNVVMTLLGTAALTGALALAVQGQTSQTATPATTAPPAPTDQAAYWPNAELQTTWKDLEARQVINRRVLEGGTYSINIRIVKEGAAPLVHGKSVDLWVAQAGTATAITGGQLVDPQRRANPDDFAGKSISGGIEQPMQAGDILFVPPGVPHGFKNIKGFRAFLIRFNTK
jgi:mannose-6-phosphate isomerase-like protein (cupin superfamily)